MKIAYAFALCGVLALGACAQVEAPVPASVVASARDAKYGLDAGYAASLRVATAWAAQPRCSSLGAPPVPLCSTAKGVLTAEAARLVARSALDRLDAVIAVATTASAIDTALAAAQQAVAAYNAVAKGGN